MFWGGRADLPAFSRDAEVDEDKPVEMFTGGGTRGGGCQYGRAAENVNPERGELNIVAIHFRLLN